MKRKIWPSWMAVMGKEREHTWGILMRIIFVRRTARTTRTHPPLSEMMRRRASLHILQTSLGTSLYTIVCGMRMCLCDHPSMVMIAVIIEAESQGSSTRMKRGICLSQTEGKYVNSHPYIHLETTTLRFSLDIFTKHKNMKECNGAWSGLVIKNFIDHRM